MTSPPSPKSNPSDLFTDSKLNSLPEFNYLQSELHRFYSKNFTQQQGDNQHSYKWKKSLAWNLQVLLTEITHTDDPDKRQEMLTRTYKWYNDYLKIRETSPDPFKTIQKEEHKIIINEEIPRSRSSNRTFIKPYMPRIRDSLKRQEIAKSALKSFDMMRKNETLKLNNKEFVFKPEMTLKPLTEKKTAVAQSFAFDERGKDDGNKLPQLFDFRSVSHKSKYLQQRLVPSPVLNSQQMKLNEIKDVHFIKTKLAKKKQTVCVDTLEKALVNV